MDGGGRKLLSLGRFARHKRSETIVEPVQYASGSRRVLPRVLRKPARLFNRLLDGNITISRRGWAAIAVTGLMIAVGATYSNSRGGQTIVADISARMGFTINNIVVDGLNELSENEIISSLDLGDSKSLFSFDIAGAREDLRKNAWVKDVVVAKAYPDRLVVKVTEREPFAIWQKGSSLALIERDGTLIDRFDERYGALPLMVGAGANGQGAEIYYQVNQFEMLAGEVKAYVRIGNRRWDLRLKNGIVVKLPQENVDAALGRLVQMDKEHALLARDIGVVDLRLDDRLVVSLSARALQNKKARAEELAANGREKRI